MTYYVTFLQDRKPARQLVLSFSEIVNQMKTIKNLVLRGVYTNVNINRFDKNGKLDQDFSLIDLVE